MLWNLWRYNTLIYQTHECSLPLCVKYLVLTPPQHAITYCFVIVGTGYTTSGNTLDPCSGYTYCEHVTQHIDYCSIFQRQKLSEWSTVLHVDGDGVLHLAEKVQPPPLTVNVSYYIYSPFGDLPHSAESLGVNASTYMIALLQLHYVI